MTLTYLSMKHMCFSIVLLFAALQLSLYLSLSLPVLDTRRV